MMRRNLRDFFVFSGLSFCLITFCVFSMGAALKETPTIDATPVSLYGNYNNTVKRIAVDSNGRMILSSNASGNLTGLTTLTANTINANLINLNGSPLSIGDLSTFTTDDLAQGDVNKYANANYTSFGLGAYSGNNSVAYGVNANASVQKSVAIGYNSLVTGTGSSGIAIGDSSVSHPYGIAIGQNANAGTFSVAIGQNTKIDAWNSFGFGEGIDVTSTGLVALGSFPEDDGNSTKSLIVGNGTGKLARRNAFTIYKDGNATINGSLQVNGGLRINTTTVNAATYNAAADDCILNVAYTAMGAVTNLQLMTASTLDGKTYVVKDSGGAATSNNITITTEGAQKIDGADTYVMNANYQSINLESDGSNWFVY